MKFPIAIASSATRRTAITLEQEARSIEGAPTVGDVVLGRVLSIGRHRAIEGGDGVERLLSPGTICAVVLGSRYSTAEFHGEVPDGLKEGDRFDLLNTGGVAGRVIPRTSAASGPTVLGYLGHAIDGSGRKLSTFDSPIAARAGGAAPRVILIVGSSMDSGKTTSAAFTIQLLSGPDFPVGGAKLTGTSRMKDLFKMKGAHAIDVADFLDVGFPSTSGCSQGDLEHIFETLTGYLGDRGARAVVMEAADGVFQREVELVLSSKKIMANVKMIIACATDSVSAYGMAAYLKRAHAIVPDYISGIITSLPLFMEELADRTEIPFFDDSHTTRDRLIKLMKENKARVR
jgi:hypothetical protein